MTSYFKGPLTGFDIESTGVDQWDDRVVQFAMVYSHAEDMEPIKLEWLIDPGIEVAEGAAEVHGLSTEHVREFGTPAAEAIPEIADRMERIVELGIPFVIFNATFDTTMIYNEFERYNVPLKYTREQMFSRVIDPYVIDKAVDKYRKGKRRLEIMSKHYGYDLTNAHDATADVEATLHITRKLGKFFKPEMDIDMLQLFQKDAKIEQNTSLQAYLRKTPDDDGNLRPDLVLSLEWPYLTTKETN